MTLYLIVGTNGAGKSTFLANLLQQGRISEAEYVSQGFHNANYFSKMDLTVDKNKLKKFIYYKIDKLILNGKSIIFEHALSKNDVFRTINKAKANSYRIVTYYFTTPSPLTNIANIKKRVDQGGHTCNRFKVVYRYFLALANYSRVKKVSDSLFVVDNDFLYEIK